MAVTSTLQRLSKWYLSHCDGDWEHTFGIKVGTLDNPGWFVEINLQGTPLEAVPFPAHEQRYDHDTDWITCRRDEKNFEIDCGPEQLETALQVFLDWAEGFEKAG